MSVKKCQEEERNWGGDGDSEEDIVNRKGWMQVSS